MAPKKPTASKFHLLRRDLMAPKKPVAPKSDAAAARGSASSAPASGAAAQANVTPQLPLIGGSPSPGTTAATASEPEPAQVSAPLEEQHLRGSPTATVPPVALPETTVAAPPPEQQLVPVLAPVQEQPTPVVLPETTVAASPTALLKISLTPTEAQPSTSHARAMMALTSSPSQLNISTATAASAPGSPALTSMARGVSSAMVSSLADAPEFLQISLVYLNSLAKTVVDYMVNGRGTLNSFRPLLEAGLNGVRSVGNIQWFERCSEIILHLEEQLQRFEALGQKELQPEIVSTMASLQVAEVARREAVERDLAERERQVAELHERNIRKQEELERSTTSMNSLRDRLVEAEAEVLRLKAELSREENVVNILSTQNTTGTLEYHTQARALAQARNEAAAIIWFVEASRIPKYDVYTSCINEIRELYRSRSGSASTRLPGMEEYLSCEQEEIGAVEAPQNLPTIEPSEGEVPMGIEKGKPIADSPEDKTTEEIPAEEPAPKPRSLRSVVAVEEEALLEDRICAEAVLSGLVEVELGELPELENADNDEHEEVADAENVAASAEPAAAASEGDARHLGTELLGSCSESCVSLQVPYARSQSRVPHLALHHGSPKPYLPEPS
ncbi:uncharacterized protein LOC109835186 [Asparagus officinalis]|uniref:uncharacterized protein LOC109835186 n=1 Tax=Asparagus officinalis TaxID=4686 RepID=UPI00098E49D2|nr:uncharacterized protein LOC109835186 [Asparagus officinalis]